MECYTQKLKAEIPKFEILKSESDPVSHCDFRGFQDFSLSVFQHFSRG